MKRRSCLRILYYCYFLIEWVAWIKLHFGLRLTNFVLNQKWHIAIYKIFKMQTIFWLLKVFKLDKVIFYILPLWYGINCFVPTWNLMLYVKFSSNHISLLEISWQFYAFRRILWSKLRASLESSFTPISHSVFNHKVIGALYIEVAKWLVFAQVGEVM